MKYLVLPLLLVMTGCSSPERFADSFSWERINDLFTLSLTDDATKWYPSRQWTIEDIHVYTNLEMQDLRRQQFIRDSKLYRNGTCLLAAESKYELALTWGYDERDLEIVVIKLTEDAALKADWSDGWPTHAVLRYKDEIFDNGFISATPFYTDELDGYGEKVTDVWSRYQK